MAGLGEVPTPRCRGFTPGAAAARPAMAARASAYFMLSSPRKVTDRRFERAG